MRHRSTLILKGSIILIGAVALTICVLLPWAVGIGEESQGELSYLRIPLLLGVYACAIPFFLALYQAFCLLINIDTGSAFSASSVNALKVIQRCAGIVCAILTVGGLPFFYIATQAMDAPGLMVIGLTLTFAAFIIAVFASLLQRLLRDAIAAKTENDLTV